MSSLSKSSSGSILQTSKAALVAFVKVILQPKGSSADFEIRIGNLRTFRD